MVEADFELTEGDVGKVLQATLLDADDEPVSLTGVTSVKFNMGSDRAGTLVINGGTATVDADQVGNKGVVYYTFVTADVGTPGDFDACFVVVKSGVTSTYPTDPRLRVRIKRKLG